MSNDDHRATQPLVSCLAKVCDLGTSGAVVVSALLACRPSWKVTMIRAGFGPRDGPEWTRLAEIEAT